MAILHSSSGNAHCLDIRSTAASEMRRVPSIGTIVGSYVESKSGLKKTASHLRLHISAVEGLLCLNSASSDDENESVTPKRLPCDVGSDRRNSNASIPESSYSFGSQNSTDDGLNDDRGLEDFGALHSPSDASIAAAMVAASWASGLRYPEEVRKERVRRYLFKRNKRRFGPKKIRYEVRKTLADQRPRVKGRFAKPNETAPCQSTLDRSPPFSGNSSPASVV
mmetsp:Transcript_45617/g.74361  ORF Transcript_45617/g.74361 Transcript_45617/m.74361 type:complete len:223 (-) Transcript_45617:878-1546(-)|eukprot:CAMPEP_0184662058 /NCGR_PEP_ID=MMETSP0308-20130426/41362_1 /TAXON_ID=38269 /ORGANISM="Gloeochaete witrockiana, Strain SAG 46.84" /LENGTH=222 /DNA_ID=CAMNT_0027103791 /DNA_START=164 /DNA_END=832 /DNA_ORIENTATION=+